MGKVQLLPEALASQVAAGEVVERPASVVKELVENSIDAGASNIEVRVQRGGIALIRVTDDGCGMSREDALMSLERNATSKIRTKEDLAAIHTLGFRGEAVPSIASVSKFRLTTREPDSLSGTEIIVNGGKLEDVRDCGEPVGTQIEIRSLFYNLPARRKFLRTENTEYSHLEQVLKTQAIAHESIRFSLVRNDRLQFQLPAASSLRERIVGLIGQDLGGRLLEITPFEHKGVTVRGLIGPPGMGRSDRKQQLTFLNGRPVESPAITRGLREGYHTALMKGQYPVTFLFLEMDPTAVDVNVHPAKKEVRFHDGYGVQQAIIHAVQGTLRQKMERPVAGVGLTGIDKPATPTPPQATAPAATETQSELIPLAEQRSLRSDWAETPRHPEPSVSEAPAPSLFTAQERARAGETEDSGQVPYENESAPSTPPVVAEPENGVSTDGGLTASEKGARKAAEYRFLGVLGKLYVLLESSEGLVMMDQHAAHERVLFEILQEQMERDAAPSQGLLTPLMLDLPPRDYALVSENIEKLAKLGIHAEPFGNNTLKIDAVFSKE